MEKDGLNISANTTDRAILLEECLTRYILTETV